MKKTVFVVSLLLCFLIALSSCSVSVIDRKPNGSGAENSLSGEKHYDLDLASLSQSAQYEKCLDIMNHFDQYVGKTVRLDGTYQFQNYHFIIITDITLCCSTYFEFLYDGPIPEAGSEIILCGTLDYYSDSAGTYPYIQVSSLMNKT